MPINQLLLQEFEQELKSIRATIERLPEEKFDWAPHAKSMPLGKLAGHLAEIPGWGTATIAMDDFDIAPPGGEPWKPFVPQSRQEVLDKLDAGAEAYRQGLANCDDQKMMANWRFLRAGMVMMEMPRYVALRSFIMNHGIHHRAQLGVYLRLLDVAVPSVYGPSADENPMAPPPEAASA